MFLSVFPICLFAQLESNYVNKYVKVTLKNGGTIGGKVIRQTDEQITLEFGGGGNFSLAKDRIEQIIVVEDNPNIEKRNYGAGIPSGFSIEYRFFWARIKGMSEETQYPIVRLSCTNNSNIRIDNIDFKVVYVWGKEILSEVEESLSGLPQGYSKTIDLLCEKDMDY